MLGVDYYTYADNISKYCVAECPYPYYGQNNTN